ncbi:MAG: hypothetical protein HY352_06330 [Candidatus Omnitrophica bacterium]|nr:hypothetical protein [Candidatus Omnitrophota bacterium]
MVMVWGLKSLLFLFVSLFLTGLVRLWWARKYTYDLSIKDPAVLRKGDMVLTGKQSIRDSWYIQVGNVLTRKLKHRFWTHAALYAGEGKLWEAQPEGVREANIAFYLENGYYVRAFRHRYIQEVKVLDDLVTWCASKQRDGYDVRGAIFYACSTLVPLGFNFIFDTSWLAKLANVQDKYFCSELIVEAFEENGYPISPFDAWRVKPSDFISNPVLAEVSPS